MHALITATRRDATHEATTSLARRLARIGSEDLDVRGRARSRSLARSIMDGAFGEFRQQLSYKARMTGALVVMADRFHSSSKICSCCGVVEAEPALSQRTFRWDGCGHEADRDINAACKLGNLAASFAVTACGEERSGPARKGPVKRSLAKRELDGGAA